MKTKSIVKIINSLSFILIGLFLTSCWALTTGKLTFSKLNYPASMSAYLYDQNYKSVVKGQDLDSVGYFCISKSFYSIVYGAVKLNSENKLVNSINTIVDHYQGDGIINLKVTIEHGYLDKIYSFMLYLPCWIPIVPSNAKITVEGEVVKLRKSVSFAPLRIEPGFIEKNKILSTISKKIYEME